MINQRPAPARSDNNPFVTAWSTPFGVPPFGEIRPEHFKPAFARAFAEHEAEIAEIVKNSSQPTFENTIEPLELSGRALARVNDVFNLLAGADTNDALLALERELSPRLASHWNKIRMNAALFARIAALYRARERLELSPEQARVLERYHTEFWRNGAAHDEESKQKLAALTERLAALGTAFSQNVLADEQAYALKIGRAHV